MACLADVCLGVVSLFAKLVGLYRDRALSTMLAVIASCYWHMLHRSLRQGDRKKYSGNLLALLAPRQRRFLVSFSELILGAQRSVADNSGLSPNATQN